MEVPVETSVRARFGSKAYTLCSKAIVEEIVSAENAVIGSPTYAVSKQRSVKMVLSKVLLIVRSKLRVVLESVCV